MEIRGSLEIAEGYQCYHFWGNIYSGVLVGKLRLTAFKWDFC